MSDLETRLREVLDERASAAPEAIGLAAGARRRLRRRRTSWAVAAAAVAAAVVPLGLGRLGDGGAGTRDDPTLATEPPAQVAPGFRAESWHDLTFQVPVSWGHGGVTTWCRGAATPEEVVPDVMRPDTMVERSLCTPSVGYGVTIASAAAFDPANASGAVWQYDTAGVDEAIYPDGAWLGYWYGSADVVTVVTPDRDLTRHIVDSVTRFEGDDPNGCPPDLGEAEATKAADRPLTLCRYDEQDLLAASGGWTGEAAHDGWEALERTAVMPDAGVCADGAPTSRIAILAGDGYRGTAVLDGCREGMAIYFEDSTRQLTDAARDVLTSIG